MIYQLQPCIRHYLLFLMVLLVACSQQDSRYEKAMEAFNTGDYPVAMEKFMSLAESGDRRSQYMLGLMYERELGVDRDYSEAARWYLKASEQGLASAQIRLAQLYISGKGVQKDY